MKTDDLITALAQDAPVRWPFGRAVAAAMAGGAVVAGVIFFAGVGIRPDVMQAVETVRYLFKFVVTLALAVTATGLILHLARPGVPLGAWRWALLAAPVLLVVSVALEMMAMPMSSWGGRWIGTNAPWCLTLIPLMALGPLALLLLALRQGAPRRPGLAGAVAGLVASGIAATFYAAHCPDDSPFFVATWYTLATGIVVLIGALAGRRWLRW
ncbi:NrsF family protein [Inquilinus sp. Marseille-Q2685]|uniref:NrsF family protein n=1 Tax=Inquilinus sp. Marseille-Q2685 TaxID=2866581 RepID=UPI001CE3D77A|nr:NrsF family protein [Inquilinus sp. Marseille-Q2685]